MNKSRIKTKQNKKKQVKTGQGIMVDDQIKVNRAQMLKITLLNFPKSNFCSYLAVIEEGWVFIAWSMQKPTGL